MKETMHYRALTVSIVIGTALLAACGSESSSSEPTAAVTTQEATSAAAFNDADVYFAQSMIPHHQQAIEMADIALDPAVGASAAVLDLATRIKGGQDPEIALMTGWLKEWGQPTMADLPGHDMSSMNGMMTSAEMESLSASAGTQFDALWTKMMIQHHQGAIEMATTVMTDGKHTDVLALAGQVIAAQQGEIAEMTALLDS
jgi:uncharacterized protein (DUF305 family)